MKTIVCAGGLLWLTLAVELAWSSGLRHGALLFPVACCVMFWLRSASGIALCGFVLLLDWTARPTEWPLCPMLLPMSVVFAVAPVDRHVEHRSRILRLSIPVPLQLPLLTITAVLLHWLSTLTATDWLALKESGGSQRLPGTYLLHCGLIAVPVSALLSLCVRAADELGFRRSGIL